MEWSSVADRRRAEAWFLPLTVLVIATVAALGLGQELANDAWQDEAMTLMRYARHGFWYPFTDYTLPNNHMLFSALLALWWERGDSMWWARLLPAVGTLLAVVGLWQVGRRIIGPFAAALAVVLFLASDVSQAFVLAIRGYALSWPLVVVQLAAVRPFVLGRRAGAAVVFAVASVLGVAVIPTNVLFGVICVAWALCAAPTTADVAGCLRRALAALAATAAGLALYLPHLAMIEQHAARDWSEWAPWPLLGHWLGATLGDYVVLLPLLVLGLLAPRGDAAMRTAGHPARDLLLCFAALAALAVLLAPVALFPRLLVPGLPLWFLALGGVLASGWTTVLGRARLRRPAVQVAVVLGCAAAGLLTPACAGRAATAPGTYDLCEQFYRHDYRPQLLLRTMEDVFGRYDPPVLMDSEAIAGLGFAYWNQPRRHLRLIEYKRWRTLMGDERRPAFAVSASVAAVERMFDRLAFARPARIELVADSGYFDLYLLHWP